MDVARRRLFYIDNIRVLLIILVVAHHAAQPYGPTGGRWPLTNPEHSHLLGPFFHVNASFFMGLFFLVSAYFLPAAYERKGAGNFLKERFLRLGVLETASHATPAPEKRISTQQDDPRVCAIRRVRQHDCEDLVPDRPLGQRARAYGTRARAAVLQPVRHRRGVLPQ